MDYRVRSWSPDGHPLPNMDVTTGSRVLAADEAECRARRYGSWDEVSVSIAGQRPLRGDELRLWCEAAL